LFGPIVSVGCMVPHAAESNWMPTRNGHFAMRFMKFSFRMCDETGKAAEKDARMYSLKAAILSHSGAVAGLVRPAQQTHAHLSPVLLT
jgi:hypothetical protein